MTSPISPFVRKMVAQALSQLGVKETGDNNGIPYMRYSIETEKPAPWCARFVRWCVESAGGSLPGNRYKLPEVAYMEGQFIKNKWFWKDDPQPGDVVFYKSRDGSDKGTGRHVGIVVAYDLGVMTTIEGNWGDQVSRRYQKRPWPNVTGFGRLPTDGGAVH